MKKNIFYFIGLSLLATTLNLYSQEVIRLYPGVAPGSESWDWKEQKGIYIKDVTQPTITAFLPENPNGIAVIIAPGGAFHFLSYEAEGVTLAKWLNDKGITAFVLKYRLVHEDPDKPYLKKMLMEKDSKLMDSVCAPVVPLATQDGLMAIEYVRNHAAEYNIDTERIGIEGSSAGGTIAMSVALSATDYNRPNFVASTYGYEGLVIGSNVPNDRTPLFICAASDDDMVPIQHSLKFYNMWIDANQPVEMHIYQNGNHGFVGSTKNLPVDTWFERFVDWIFINYSI
ncbi:alpha/beta hydrolase [uncultured Draconibacterium sp.]|uniref:alpha/beta hydrolase n=1 Tax=uncultured Draconibacterium sp. TaxID=1573823 RepID=UPI0032178240